MKNETVSIITPLYNAEKYVAETIESVLVQSYTCWEMLIVDDSSTDASVNIVEQYRKKDDRIQLFKLEKNSGPATARNLAIEKASGRYIAFLDADDLWLPEKLEKQIRFMNLKNATFICGSYKLRLPNGKETIFMLNEKIIERADILKQNPFSCLVTIYDTQALGKCYIQTKLPKKCPEDYVLWLDIFKKAKKAHSMKEPLAIYRLVSNSRSSNKIRAAFYQWYVYRKIEKLSLIKSIYYFLHYAYNGIKKYYF